MKKRQPPRKKTQPPRKSEPGFFKGIWREVQEQSRKEEEKRRTEEEERKKAIEMEAKRAFDISEQVTDIYRRMRILNEKFDDHKPACTGCTIGQPCAKVGKALLSEMKRLRKRLDELTS